ncbi:hypothetical protein HN958_01865 [Candidatus Falkowbacteria bacterium]|jgi:hypothetical protein|nr:hypothetical protein [Candidatus Falkowbacteria bacterium]
MKFIKKIIIVIYIVMAGALKGVLSAIGRLDHVDKETNDKEIHLDK